MKAEGKNDLAETAYWLELLEDSRALSRGQSAPLLDECHQLIAILVTISKRARENK